MPESRKFFLFIGSSTSDAAVSKLKTANVHYRIKRLESYPENWQKIIDLLEDPLLVGVVAKITGSVYGLIDRSDYAECAPRLLEALGKTNHVAFIHETILLGEDEVDSTDVPQDDEYEEWTREDFYREYFRNPPAEVRERVESLLHAQNIQVTPFKTNAEVSVLAASFIDDHDKNLLFRIYVPSSRIYAGEADKLIGLFREWLARVGKHGVRQDGYRTGAGQVYEFFGDETLDSASLRREFSDFSTFLTMCAEDPSAAAAELSALVPDRRDAADIVSRYGKEARRLQIDLRQERESRMLAIRHRIESDFLEISHSAEFPWGQIDEFINSSIPAASSPMHILSLSATGVSPVTVNVNQQIIHAVESTIVQNVQGTVHLGPEAKELLSLIERFGGDDAQTLESAVHEVEDDDARLAERLGAKQRLKAFLARNREAAEGVAVGALLKYLESKFGI
ncbi:hypothetical protein [Streptomyces sp. BE133]|uniref:hypothetical protein n=1 Tax=Streptomyces sp. BE133 TaxID=3002523 RepID=UPI002E7999D9|nr:hypothetical protein [Streptomyces sp. BE133]MEE1805625.1 hypothetical protein [Streptomyces sp. BE133]